MLSVLLRASLCASSRPRRLSYCTLTPISCPNIDLRSTRTPIARLFTDPCTQLGSTGILFRFGFVMMMDPSQPSCSRNDPTVRTGLPYGMWSITDLREELRKRNAKVTGKKAVLVKRLLDYDKLFGPLVTAPDSVFKINMPAPQEFRDVTADSSLPALTEDTLEAFTGLTERADVTTSKNMYDEYFLISCRSTCLNNEHYITGMVASEMRKNMIYNVTVKSKHLTILETQCECAAGMGPFAQCKHVIVVLYAIIDFNTNKKMKLRLSKTSTLQTFHQPTSVYTGEPYLTHLLTLRRNTKFNDVASYDPRFTTERPRSVKYKEHFEKHLKNFCGQVEEKKNVPMVTLFNPIDKKRIFEVHDYLEKSPEEEFLEGWILTEEEITSLQQKTLESKKLWSQERLKRLQSSEFGRICKASKSPHNLAKSLAKNSNATSEAIRHGLKYEAEAIEKFKDYSKKCVKKCGIIVHKNHQFLACTPDGLVGESSVLEVKCPYLARNKIISPEFVPYIYLCEETGEFKLHTDHNYYYQVQGQLMCTGRQTAYFCVYTINDFVVITIQRNNSFIDSMFEKLKDFYENYFKNVILQKYFYNKKI